MSTIATGETVLHLSNVVVHHGAARRGGVCMEVSDPSCPVRESTDINDRTVGRRRKGETL